MTEETVETIPSYYLDRRGHRLEVGDKVAYNQSGEVAHGELVKIAHTRPTRTWFSGGYKLMAQPVFHVRCLDPNNPGYRNTDVSRVRRSRNLMAIHE